MRKIKGSVKSERIMEGGPWHGQWVSLPRGGTMTLRIGRHLGRYNEQGEWIKGKRL